MGQNHGLASHPGEVLARVVGLDRLVLGRRGVDRVHEVVPFMRALREVLRQVVVLVRDRVRPPVLGHVRQARRPLDPRRARHDPERRVRLVEHRRHV